MCAVTKVLQITLYPIVILIDREKSVLKDKDEFMPALGPVWHDRNTSCMFWDLTIAIYYTKSVVT